MRRRQQILKRDGSELHRQTRSTALFRRMIFSAKSATLRDHALAQRQARRITLYLPIETMQVALPTAACGAIRKARILIVPVDELRATFVAETAAGEMAEPETGQVGNLFQHRAFPTAWRGDCRQRIRRRGVDESNRKSNETSEENETGTRMRRALHDFLPVHANHAGLQYRTRRHLENPLSANTRSVVAAAAPEPVLFYVIPSSQS